MMKILILAAGYGTRLYPLVKDIPKPLLIVSHQSIIDHLLEKIQVLKGVSEIIVVTNNKFYSNFKEWAEQKRSFTIPLRILNDRTNSSEDRLGSVGDIHFAIENHPMNEDLLVMGGDNLFDFPLGEFITFARGHSPHVSIGLFDIKDIKEATNFGVVVLDEGGKVLAFEEKPKKPKSTLIAMCLYFFPLNSLGRVAKYLKKTKKSDKAGDYIRWLAQENTVYGFKFFGKWYDIGSIESYREAQERFRNKFKMSKRLSSRD